MGARAKIVVLARPHPEIRPHMEPFIASAGFQPKVLSSLDELPDEGVVGAVISTTLRSPVKQSYPEVFAILQERYRGIPVMFATMAAPAAIQHNLELLVRRHIEDATVLPTAAATLIDLRKRALFLVVAKSELLDEGRDRLRTLVRRYFGIDSAS